MPVWRVRPSDLVGILTLLDINNILFLDEIYGLKREMVEILSVLLLMERFSRGALIDKDNAVIELEPACM